MPTTAVERYAEILAARGIPLRGKRVLVFGYGGRLDVAHPIPGRWAPRM